MQIYTAEFFVKHTRKMLTPRSYSHTQKHKKNTCQLLSSFLCVSHGRIFSIFNLPQRKYAIIRMGRKGDQKDKR